MSHGARQVSSGSVDSVQGTHYFRRLGGRRVLPVDSGPPQRLLARTAPWSVTWGHLQLADARGRQRRCVLLTESLKAMSR